MGKTIQIDSELFLDLWDYFHNPQSCNFMFDDIQHKLNEKYESLLNRALFTKYKRTPSGEEREKARQAYLNQRCMLRSYRTNQEYHELEPPENM